MQPKLPNATQDAPVVHGIDMVDAIEALIDDATRFGHADGASNWPPSAYASPTEAETTLRTRASRLMHMATRCFEAELSRARHRVDAALGEYRRAAERLPDAVRRARAVFDCADSEAEMPLRGAALRAEAAQRRLRAAELATGRSFSTAGAGGFVLLLAGLFAALAIEAVIATSLISESHPGGWWGAALLSLTIAAVSMAFSYSTGRVVRALVDRGSDTAKRAAAATAVVGIAAIVVFHGAVAKLRELTLSTGYDDAMVRAATDLLAAPPTEGSSLLVGLIGIGCALAGFAAGWRHADALRDDAEAAIARDAEAALEGYRVLRAELESRTIDQEVFTLLDRLQDEVAAAQDRIGDAVQTWERLREAKIATQVEIQNAFRLAILNYRVRAARLRTAAPTDAWTHSGDVEPVPLLAFGDTDDTTIDDARRALSATTFAAAFEEARQALERHGRSRAELIAERLEGIEAVLLRDGFRPARVPQSEVAYA